MRELTRAAANAAVVRMNVRPWRVAVTEASMLPAIEPGDWLVVNPRVGSWPRPGAVVVFREPISDALAIKRVAAGPGERVRFADGYLTLAPDEAWLVADAPEGATRAAGFGAPIDSTRFGPVSLEQLVGRVLFRYGPLRRFGRISRKQATT
ncbi:MAG: S26 family signal peptidase [Candidatus Limnocylindrales bacterium]